MDLLITTLLIPMAPDPIAPGDGILSWLDVKSAAALNTLRAIAVLLSIFFVIVQGVRTRGALATIIVSGFAAAVFCWIVFNVTDLQTRVDDEVNASGPVALTKVVPEPARL